MPKFQPKHVRAPQNTRFVVVLFQSLWPAPGAIDDPLLEKLVPVLDKVVTTDPTTTHIDVWLNSNGGCTHVAYRIWLALRARCCHLRVVVPNAAKSAASLLAVGADEIVMGSTSVLGPLDVQWDHPYGIDQTISGLDVANYTSFLAQFAAAHIDSQEAATFFQPLVEKFDGLLMMRIRDELRVGAEYAEAMLNGRAQPAPEGFCASTVARELVYGFPSHQFAISRGRAASMGLPVVHLEEFAEREIVREAYNGWSSSRAGDGSQLSIFTVHKVKGSR